MASVGVGKTMKTASQHNDNEKGKVGIPTLAMVDDIAKISVCGTPAVSDNAYSRVPNKRTPPLIRNFQKNPKNWPNFDEKNQFSKKQKSSHENRMLEINELIILHIFHTFLYPR